MSGRDGERREDLNGLALPALYARLSAGGLVRRLFEIARDEDLGPGGKPGDLTSLSCVDAEEPCKARVAARRGGVVAGLAAAEELCAVVAPEAKVSVAARDGDRVAGGAVIAELEGPLRSVLAAERPMLNLLGRLSGIATLTSAYVSAAGPGSRAKVYDTRKTTPGLRVLEKYAVRCGGGWCHRIGLFDAVLIKDNHIAGVRDADLAGVVALAAERARALSPAFIEVEVDTLDQFRALLTLPAGTIDLVLLDNMGPDRLREAAGLRDAQRPTLGLEASGGVTLETIGAIAGTGVDRVSVGALTHSAPSLDLGLDIGETMGGVSA